MSNNSIDGRLKGLEEKMLNEMRNQREGTFNPSGLGSARRSRPPPIFANNKVLSFPPRSPHTTETEIRLREVYKISGKLKLNGEEYHSRIDDLQHLGELGSGTCGHVVKMLHKPSSTVIAVKQMRRSGNSEETKRILMDLEIVVRSYACPYIVRCLGCFVTDADVWICMELMASCFDKLLKRLGAPIPEAILGKVTVATVNALSYLKNTHDVIHRDVKPSNILLDERGNIKLCDFGISGRLVDSKAKTRSAGCAAYMAPERIDPPDPNRPDYDIRADVWSLGISLVELATGVFPYRDCQNDFEVLTRVIEQDPPQLPEDCDFSSEFKSFVSQCLTKNYRQRPKYNKLLEHPFVVKSERSNVSVSSWYASLTPSASHKSITVSHFVPAVSNGHESPPVPNFLLNVRHLVPEPLSNRGFWSPSPCVSGGSSSQPASLETEFSSLSPYPRRRTLDACASPPPPPVRRVSADQRWRASPQSSGNTSPIVLQRFYHQNQQRRSRFDMNSTPHRNKSLSREHSTGRSPEPPPRTSRQQLLGYEGNVNMEMEPPLLLERLHPQSPLLRNDRYNGGRSSSLTRAELHNGHHREPPPVPPSHPTPHPSPMHSHPTSRHDDQGAAHSPQPARHLNTARWGGSESWSVPSSPLPPRAPPPRPAE